MTTNDNYIPVKGDRVRRDWWGHPGYVDIEYVGRRCVVGTDERGKEAVLDFGEGRDALIKVEPPPVPLPDSWYSVTELTIASGAPHSSAQEALDHRPWSGPAIAALRLHTDENGEDHAEIVRSTPTQGE